MNKIKFFRKMSALLSKTQQYTKEAEGGIYTGTNVKTGPTPAQTTTQFARGGLDSRSQRDELMKEKMEFLAENRNGMTPFGQVQATDEDFKWLQKKRETEAAANLDAWVGGNFHTGDVTTRRWLQDVYPEYYQVREQQMMDQAKFALRVKLLLLRGPKNQKDLILLWGLQTGQIKLDRNWDRIGPTGEQIVPADEQERFKKGLLNPLRYLTDAERKDNQRTNNNPFKPATEDMSGGQLPGFAQHIAATPRYPGFLKGVMGVNLN